MMSERKEVISVRRTAGDVWSNTACAGLVPIAILAFASLSRPADTLGLALAAFAVFAGAGVPLLTWFVLRADVVRLGSDRIERRGLFGGEVRRFDEIVGGRSGGECIALVGRGQHRPMLLPRFAFRNPQLKAWVNSLPNLDHQEALEAQEALERDTRLGGTRDERARTLVWFRWVAWALTWASVAVCLWVVAYPRPYDLAVIVAGSFPLLAIALAAWRPGIFTIAPGGNVEVRANLLMLFLGPSAAIAVRALRDFDLLDWIAPLAVTVPVVAGLVVVIWFVDEGARSRLMAGFLAVLLFGGAWGGLVLTNTRMSVGPPEVTPVAFLNTRGGDAPGVRIRLPASMGAREVEVDVRRATAEAAVAGEPLCAVIFPGRLGWRFILVGVCRPG